MKILFPNAVDVGCSDFVCMHGEVVQPLSVLQATEADEQLEDRPQARPVFVWTDEHIKGHFVMCYLALSMIRYLQYLMGEEGWKEVLSAEEIMTALKKPQVVVQGTYPDVIATPINVSREYLDIMKLLSMKDLRKNMTLTQFRSATKLDLNKNLSRI